MEDIISHGRPPSGGWGRRAALAVVLVAIAALVVARHVGHDGKGGPGNRGAAGKVRGVRHRAPKGPTVTVIAGPAEPWAATARMPRTGIQPAWFWPADGAFQPIGRLPRYGFGYLFTRIQGGWILQPGPAAPATCGDCSVPTSSNQPGCGSCPGPPTAVYFLGIRARAVTTIGVATMVAPAPASGSAWLTTFPASSGLGASAGIAREYDSTGKPGGPAVRLPTGYKITQATPKGLLLTAITGRQHRPIDRLWNPASRKVIRTYRNVITTTATELAITRPCTTSCQLRVLNLVTGHHLTLRITHGDPVAGEFSPDGRYLALEVRSGTGQESDTQIQIATLATGQIITVPHLAARGRTLSGFGWPGNGDYLTAALALRTSVQITYWNAASSRAAIAYIAGLDPNQLITG